MAYIRGLRRLIVGSDHPCTHSVYRTVCKGQLQRANRVPARRRGLGYAQVDRGCLSHDTTQSGVSARNGDNPPWREPRVRDIELQTARPPLPGGAGAMHGCEYAAPRTGAKKRLD